MMMVGARTSIAVAVVAVGIGMVLGVPLGLCGGGHARDAARRGRHARQRPDLRLPGARDRDPDHGGVRAVGAVNAIIAIGIFNMPVFARLTRGAALSLWTRDYIMAARVAGKGTARISVEHILPNIAQHADRAGRRSSSRSGILAEAALSYVGLGAQPPTPSWGRMLAESQTMISLAPHLALFPGLAIVLTVLGLNLMGDGLRDLFDPRAEAGAMTLLEVEGLSLAIGGAPILRDVGSAVEEGEVSALIGESGSGKSMTALSIMGLLPQGAAVTAGGRRSAGRDLLRLPKREMCGRPRAGRSGMVFQEPMTALNPVQDHRRPGGRDARGAWRPRRAARRCRLARETAGPRGAAGGGVSARPLSARAVGRPAAAGGASRWRWRCGPSC